MRVSPLWSNEIRQHPNILKQHQSLFEQKTILMESVLDKVTILSDDPFSSNFYTMLKKFSLHHRYCSKGSYYQKCYKLGCITILIEPIFSRIPKIKVILNPSNAGLTFEQVKLWVLFLFDSYQNVYVSRVEYKIDLHGYPPLEVMKRIWCSGIRKYNDERYEGQTLYIGSRFSNTQRVIYDKGKERGQTSNDWTRIEVRERYKGHGKIPFVQFISHLRMYNPFESLLLVELSSSVLSKKLHKFNCELSKEGVATVIRTLKQLTSNQKKSIINALQKEGSLLYLDWIYRNKLNKWLKN